MNDDVKNPDDTQTTPENTQPNQIHPAPSEAQSTAHVNPQSQPSDSQQKSALGALTQPPKPKTVKKWLPVAIAVVVSLALIGVAAATWSGSQNSNEMNQPQDTTDTDQDTQQQNERKIVYVQKLGMSDGDLEVSLRPELVSLTGGEISSSDSNIDGVVSYSATKDQKVLFATAGAGVRESLWFSEDSGQTYRSLFEAAPPANQNGIGGQITSLVFSNDGSSALFAYLVEENGDTANTVKEVTFSDGKVTDIFSDEENGGVFLYGYDKQSGIIYYNTGCYNCGGPRSVRLQAYNIAEKSTASVYESNKTGSGMVMNSDLTAALVRTGESGFETESRIEATPYELLKVNVVTKQAEIVVANSSELITDFGFSMDNAPYYAKGNSVYLAEGDRLLFESGQPISEVYVVDSNTVVASAGTPAAGYKLYSILFAENKVTELLSGIDDSKTVIGVVD